MQKQTVSTMLAAATILGSSMVGCSGAGLDRRPAVAAAQAPAVALRVETALMAKDFARALLQAEELVAAEPRNAGYRALLGRAYLANGRYASARTALQDAMALGNHDPRTIVSLALCHAGLGDAASARELLAQNIENLPAGDYGLAMAVTGNPQEGVRALLEAVKQPDASAQTRQNLAYALALGGAWGQARLIAGQDLSAREAEERIGQWSQAGNEQQRVIAMIGISPRVDDSGLPVRLALVAPQQDAPVQSAALDLVTQARTEIAQLAEPVEEETAVEMTLAPPSAAAPAPVSAPAASPAPSPAPVATASLAHAFSEPGSDVPLLRAPTEAMRVAARAAFKRASADTARQITARAGMSRIAPVVAPVPDKEASDWVIQLGAFGSDAVARAKWDKVSRSNRLGTFREVRSRFVLAGKTYHRLAIRGFGDRAAAWTLCQALKADGQACFVRLDDTGSTRMARARAQGADQVAARKPVPGRQIAAR